VLNLIELVKACWRFSILPELLLSRKTAYMMKHKFWHPILSKVFIWLKLKTISKQKYTS